MSSDIIVPKKRSASEQSSSAPPNPTITESQNSNKRYNILLSILTKCLAASRKKVASDAPQTIKESYGDMTSLFSSSDDNEKDDGISSLVNLLLGKLDSVHDRLNSEKISSSNSDSSTSSTTTTFTTRLEQLLQQRNIHSVLQKLEVSMERVEREEREFDQKEEADKSSAREAIKLARSTTSTTSQIKMSPSTGKKKRRVLPAENIGYHAHKLKVEYQHSLQRDLEEIEEENGRLEEELKKRWGEWQEGVEGIKGTLGKLDELGEK